MAVRRVTMTVSLSPEQGGDGRQRRIGSRQWVLSFKFLARPCRLARSASPHLGLWTLTTVRGACQSRERRPTRGFCRFPGKDSRWNVGITGHRERGRRSSRPQQVILQTLGLMLCLLTGRSRIPSVILLLSPGWRHQSDLVGRELGTTATLRQVRVPALRHPSRRGQGRSSTNTACGIGAGNRVDGTISTYLGGLPLRVLSPATCCPPLGRRDDASPNEAVIDLLENAQRPLAHEGHDKHQYPS